MERNNEFASLLVSFSEGEREGDPKAMTESESSRKWTKGF